MQKLTSTKREVQRASTLILTLPTRLASLKKYNHLQAFNPKICEKPIKRNQTRQEKQINRTTPEEATQTIKTLYTIRKHVEHTAVAAQSQQHTPQQTPVTYISSIDQQHTPAAQKSLSRADLTVFRRKTSSILQQHRPAYL